MNFGLLGDDPAAMPVIRALAHHPQHSLSHAALVGERTLAEVMNSAPGVRVCEGWDEFLRPSTAVGDRRPPLAAAVDAVLIAGHQPDVLQGAKQLASAGKPLLVFPHTVEEATWVYELTLVRDEAHVLLFPVLPLRWHPSVAQLRTLIQGGSIGRVLHFRWERVVPTRAQPGSPLVTTKDVETALLPDVDLLRCLAGDYNQVTALYSGATEPRQGRSMEMSLATVTLAGEGLPQAVWSLTTKSRESRVQSPEKNPSSSLALDSGLWTLTVTGETGTLQLSGGDDPAEITLTQDGTAVTDASAGNWNIGAAVLDRFDAALAGNDVRPDWTDLTRALEIVEGVHRSVRRRRTIDLHFETTSERGQFKTQMTALGCGLLVLTLLAVLVLLMIGALFEVNETVMRILRIAVFLPLVAFLLLQLLVFVARPSSEDDR